MNIGQIILLLQLFDFSKEEWDTSQDLKTGMDMDLHMEVIQFNKKGDEHPGSYTNKPFEFSRQDNHFDMDIQQHAFTQEFQLARPSSDKALIAKYEKLEDAHGDKALEEQNEDLYDPNYMDEFDSFIQNWKENIRIWKIDLWDYLGFKPEKQIIDKRRYNNYMVQDQYD